MMSSLSLSIQNREKRNSSSDIVELKYFWDGKQILQQPPVEFFEQSLEENAKC